VAGITSIRHYHRAQVIGDPRSAWGRMADNPTQEQVQHNGALLPLHFLINVTQNRAKEITAYFCGEPMTAHLAGCEFASKTAMVGCDKPFDVVISTNSGHPLDQNLYQAVKGMCAATQIIKPGGTILMAAECSDGFPSHGTFQKMLLASESPRTLLDDIESRSEPFDDQWQLQLIALVMLKARVEFYSTIPHDLVERAHLVPVTDFQKRASELVAGKRVAVLPEGPQTIPHLIVG